MQRALAISLFTILIISERQVSNRFQLRGRAQGTTWQLTYYAQDSVIAAREMDSLLKAVDQSLSTYIPGSLISQFNRSEKGIQADQHLATVVNKALETYRDTEGLFDITIYPLTNAWGFGPEKMDSFPGEDKIRQLAGCVSSSFLSWKNNFLEKSRPCVQLDPNGIAQGYTVDLMAMFLECKGINKYVVELGGEIRTRGRKPGGEKMAIGIEAPGTEFGFEPLQKVIYLDEGGVTTSGNYRRYVESGGTKITHLIDPKTGTTLRNELISVTVYAKDAITADAYDNALMMMGLEKAMRFVEARPDLAAHFVYFRKDGGIADTLSSRFRTLLQH